MVALDWSLVDTNRVLIDYTNVFKEMKNMSH